MLGRLSGYRAFDLQLFGEWRFMIGCLVWYHETEEEHIVLNFCGRFNIVVCFCRRKGQLPGPHCPEPRVCRVWVTLKMVYSSGQGTRMHFSIQYTNYRDTPGTVFSSTTVVACFSLHALAEIMFVFGVMFMRFFCLWQMEDNKRSIPCLVDGFKPSQRKVLFSCFKRNLKKEVKVRT